MVRKKPLRIILITIGIALLLIVVMVTGSGTKVATQSGLRMEYNPDTDGDEREPHLVTVRVQSTYPMESVEVHYTHGEGFIRSALTQIPGTPWWATTLPGREKGMRTYYFLTAEDEGGHRVVLPEEATETWTSEYDYFKLRAEGKASRWALILHVYLMLAAVLLFIHALYYALDVLDGGDRVSAMVRCVYAAVIAFFITGFPIGWMIEKQVLGNYWEGIPFGWDITDSKTLFILVFWLIPVILRLRKRSSDKGFARWVVAGTLFTIVLFLLPHSL